MQDMCAGQFYNIFLRKLNLFKPSAAFQMENRLFKVNNRNTRTRLEICSKLTIKIPERRHVIAS